MTDQDPFVPEGDRNRANYFQPLDVKHFVGGQNSLGVTFLNAWVNFDTQRPVNFYKDRGRVYLEGIMKSGAVNTNAFILPVGYRPAHAGAQLIVPVVSNGAFGVVLLGNDGTVNFGVGSNVYVDLSCISFRCVK